MTNTTNTHRDSNIELLRILAMLAIVAHHYVVNSGLTSYAPFIQNQFSVKSNFYLIFGAFGKIAINCFVLITGYYMCKSQITLNKFLKLFLEVMFYKISIYLIFLFSGYELFSLKGCLKALFPVSIETNFVGCYLIFFLLIPFLNIFIKNLNEKNHRNLLYLILFVFTILGSIPFFKISFNYITWFCVLFFISSYIRLYPKPIFENKKLLILILSSSIFLSILSIISLTFLGEKIKEFHPYFLLVDTNKIFPVIIGVTSFLFFKNLKIKYSPLINTIAATTFGILLIHSNGDAMRAWLWKDICKNIYVFNLDLFWLYTILTVLAVFIICSFIDYLRIKFIEKPVFNWLYKHNVISK